MSARVFNPLVMSEMRRMIGRSSSDGSGTTAAVARVRRDLFGPVNHEEAQAFVDKELATIRKRDTESWGFDFCRGVPMENSRFRWERVTPEENIPEAYALRRLGHAFLGQAPSTEPVDVKKDVSTNTSPSSGIQKSTQSPTLSQKSKAIGKQSQITGKIFTPKLT